MLPHAVGQPRAHTLLLLPPPPHTHTHRVPPPAPQCRCAENNSPLFARTQHTLLLLLLHNISRLPRPSHLLRAVLSILCSSQFPPTPLVLPLPLSYMCSSGEDRGGKGFRLGLLFNAHGCMAKLEIRVLAFRRITHTHTHTLDERV